MAEATTPASNPLAKVLRRFTAPEPDWSEIEEALLASDVGLVATTALIQAARDGDGASGRARVRAAALSLLGDDPANLTDEADVVLLVGVNGVGKTTTAAKLAARAKGAGLSPLLVAADTFRAAAIDQLRALGVREGVEVVEGRPGGDPAAAVHDALTLAAARDFAPVIIDTAGRMQTRSGLMDELAKIRRVVTKVAPTRTVEVLLVLDGTAGQNGLAQARGFDASAGIDGIVLTKLDSGARGGVALAVRRELGLPIRWIGTGERATDLVPFAAEAYVDGLLGAPAGS
ncbi:MAG: signal recognition particle-docking protein FtsY [Chloroflexi bacterium]|nr:signal recognition particle-docking protein FtsY [Chloroflexota bacterium]